MAMFRINDGSLEELKTTKFHENDIKERQDLQAMLRDRIDIVAPNCMVIAEEYSEWVLSKRRMDLLCIDRDANLVVVEIKRTRSGGHMELQALRYAAMASTITFEELVQAHEHYLEQRGRDPGTAEDDILDFLRWSEPDEAEFPKDVRLVLVSADFSWELSAAVTWLNNRDLDIRCVRLQPFKNGDQVLLMAEQRIPPQSGEVFQQRVREKAIEQRRVRREEGKDTGFWFMNVGEVGKARRCWEDCRKYNFMIAGGGPTWINQIKRLKPGHLIFAYLSGRGYVGLGRVIDIAVPQRSFIEPESGMPLLQQSLERQPKESLLDADDRCDWCVPVKWIATVDRTQAIKAQTVYRNTTCRIKKPALVDELLKAFQVDEGDLDTGSDPTTATNTVSGGSNA